LPLYIQRLSEHATVPTRGSEYAAGLDLSAAEDIVIRGNGGRALVKTDLRIACPPGTYVRIAPRSGLAYKFGIDVGAGVIDADYRGPVGVILFNFGTEDFVVNRGDRIAQAILEQICVPSVIIDVPKDEELPKVGTRGTNGFGSTGVSVEPPVSDSSDDTGTNANKKARQEESNATITPSPSLDSTAQDEVMNDK
jgi:dUTP pyrophosphatase